MSDKTAPAVMFIEMALATIKDTDAADWLIPDEIKEFRELGEGRLVTARGYNRLAGLTDIERGYLIGLETGRIVFYHPQCQWGEGVQEKNAFPKPPLDDGKDIDEVPRSEP